jgi:esterase/lipase
MVELGVDYSKFSAINNITNVHVPVLIFQAQNDEFINKDDPKVLFDLANNPKEFWSALAPHDIHYNLPKEFEKNVLVFLNKI